MHSIRSSVLLSLSLLCVSMGVSGPTQAQQLPPQPNLGGGFQPAQMIPAGDQSLPPNPQPGKCYARVWEPAVYTTVTEQVLEQEAAERIELIPAKYETVEERVLVRPAYMREEIVPAVYETVTEQVMVKPASTRWKKGRGLVEKVDNFTGEIMCLVEDPAEYRTITKQVLKHPATTRKIQVPAEYKTVKVQKLIAPAQEKHIPIPAKYQTVTKQVLQSPGRMAWKSVICETNAPQAPVKQAKVKPVKVQPLNTKPAITEIHAQSSSEKKGDDNWFFFWDYDELFGNGKMVPAERDYPFVK